MPKKLKLRAYIASEFPLFTASRVNVRPHEMTARAQGEGSPPARAKMLTDCKDLAPLPKLCTPGCHSPCFRNQFSMRQPGCPTWSLGTRGFHSSPYPACSGRYLPWLHTASDSPGFTREREATPRKIGSHFPFHRKSSFSGNAFPVVP